MDIPSLSDTFEYVHSLFTAHHLSSATRNPRVSHGCLVMKRWASPVLLRITQDWNCQLSSESQCLLCSDAEVLSAGPGRLWFSRFRGLLLCSLSVSLSQPYSYSLVIDGAIFKISSNQKGICTSSPQCTSPSLRSLAPPKSSISL